MNRITRKIRVLKETGGKAVIPYMTPEFPHKGITPALLNGLTLAGADMIEVGIPFSDPLADGKTIQHSSEVAIRNGATISGILRDVRTFRSEHDLPLILMGYVNPILRYGVERFAQDAAEAGVDGLIVPDLPPEEASDVTRSMNRTGLSTIFLIAPTTSSERIKTIDAGSTDFSYCVSVAGVTGQRVDLDKNGELDSFLQRVRSHAKKPFVVGFGISTKEHVRRVWNYAFGAVVGSAMIDAMKNSRSSEDAVNAASDLVRKIRPVL